LHHNLERELKRNQTYDQENLDGECSKRGLRWQGRRGSE
jgi:hypothetical protein